MRKPLIVALDYADTQSALNMASKLDPSACRVKVGKELFTVAGPAILDALHQRGFEIFLDLKFHDIPNTVASAIRVAVQQQVWMVNVHAMGGRRMLEAARDARDSVANAQTRLIAVTLLTSMEHADLKEIGLLGEPQDWVVRLAQLSANAGLDGIVCSAQEVSALKATLPDDFNYITPGIRPSAAEHDDQRRVMTPVEALKAGSDYLVIGRPITQSPDPAATCQAIIHDINLAF